MERYGRREVVPILAGSIVNTAVRFSVSFSVGTYHVKGESEMNSRASSLIAAGLMAIVLTCAARLSAGPPLICHAIEIGQAQTLPWVDLNYHEGDG